MKNSIERKNSKLNSINKVNFSILKSNKIINQIPKLYQKKKVTYILKTIPLQNNSSIKKDEKYSKNIFELTNYKNFYKKTKIIKGKYINNTINKSNISTLNTTTNNINNRKKTLSFTLNILNDLSNTINNNLLDINKNKIYHNKNHSYNIELKKKIIKNEKDDDTNVNELINEETEEKIPVHISNYKGGLKGNIRNWGIYKTEFKEVKKVSKIKIKYKFKYKILSNGIKKKLLYEDKNNTIYINNEKKNNLEIIDYKNDNLLTSPNDIIKYKQLNFDQPFKCIKNSHSNKNFEKNVVKKFPKLINFNFPNSILKKNKNYYINTTNNEKTIRNEEKENIFKNYYEIKKKYIKTDENISHKENKIALNINKLNIKTEKQNKIFKLIHSYTIKRHKNNTNICNYYKFIHQNINNINKKIFKLNLSDIVFDIINIKVKHYIENFLDNKSLMKLSSLNKIFYKNFRYAVYNRYYEFILIDINNKENIKQIIKSLLKYSCHKLKNKSKDEIKKIYKSFNYKSNYNESIIKDIARTFPQDIAFKKNSLGYYKLFNILTAYSNYNEQIGYAQGLNFISAVGLSLFNEEEEVFIFLDGLLNRFRLEKFIGINNNNLVNNLKYFSNILNKYVPDIISFFYSKSVNHEFFSTNWILTLFTNCMNRNCLIIIWCFMIIFGWKFFYCLTIELLKFYKEDIFLTEEKELNSKMKNLLNCDKFEQNLNLIIKNTLQLMKNSISL